MHLRELLERGAFDRIALREPSGLELTYARLRGHVDGLASALIARGIGPGDRVAISLPNGADFIEAFFAIAVARATAAPLNPAYTCDELRFYLEDIGAKAILVAPGGGTEAREAADRAGIAVVEIGRGRDGEPRLDGAALPPDPVRAQPHQGDVALFLHTSGTTSRPKGVPLTHDNLCTSASNIARWYALEPADVSLCIMPLFHVHGLVFSTMATLLAGAGEIVPERFSASAFWPLVKDNGVTVVSAVPTIYRTLMLRAEEDDVPKPGEHSLRFFRSSSAALPATLMQALSARFGVPVIEAYSMTEASHQMCANPLDGPHRPGSVGVGAFVEVGVLNDAGELLGADQSGEIVIRGRNVTRGYHNNAAANAAAFRDGWFRTGDVGTIDRDGYVTLAGRIKELINRGGEKVSPIEVDEALLSHPGVREAVTFGVPDDKYGERVAAAVVLRDGTSIDDVRAHVTQRLAAFKVPADLYVVNDIPKTATGKVQRRLVAQALLPQAPGR